MAEFKCQVMEIQSSKTIPRGRNFLPSAAVLEESHARTVRSCAWSPPFKLLAVACSDATTAIWKNVGDAYERVYTLEGHDNEVRSVSWNVNGELLATCGGDKSVWIWEVLPGNEFDCVSVLQGYTEDVKMVQWLGDYDLFSCSNDNTIKVWEETREEDDWPCIQTLGESDRKHVRTLSGYHDRTIFSVDWMREEIHWVPVKEPAIIASDKRLLASASDDGTVKIWELVCPWPAGHMAS
ncbi:hypothetical protein RND71_031140 [Anisodus tanguticus]|uniref:Cytosolic iron-sulfur protein assembly protein CIAO1 homolog n=1 Tax=Anisodus tanguticus TaxID=243964 RepID=A0AAE1V5A5_9SOLA|nr:hypothetical protein RND71_031140 [Anisodus tanguticus]